MLYEVITDMRSIEAHAYLVQYFGRCGQFERPVLDEILETPASKPAHDQISPASVSPEIVERYDVQML